MIDPWEVAELEMIAEGYSLKKVPEYMFHRHVWGDALLFFWGNNHRLPTSEELCSEMWDEWDDPVPLAEAEEILGLLKAGVTPK